MRQWSTLLLIVSAALIICGAGWLINRQITVRLDRALGVELTHNQQIAALAARIRTLEARP